MASTNVGKQTAKVNPMRHSLPLTLDDSKILGNTTERRRKKAVPPPKFQSRMFKTHNSAWTPMVSKVSNEQIFNERTDLIVNWFDLWTDSQRKRFLAKIFDHCKKSQLFFIQSFFDRFPLKHADFTKVLPRFLSLYIFSFLDPRSLCRASLVSWNWKFITEQDLLWQPKCTRFGWYIPYTPTESEYGAWKKHYVACIRTLDMDIKSKNEALAVYGALERNKQKERKRKSGRLSPNAARETLEARPAWQHPDKTPRDLDRSHKALVEGYNPNDPKTEEALNLHSNRWGIAKKKTMIPTEYGLQTGARKGQHRILHAEKDDEDLRPHSERAALSQGMELESYEEQRLMELVHMPWEPPPPAKPHSLRRPNLSGGGAYPIPWKHNTSQPVSKCFPSQANPRVIFISSRVPAADVLVDAVMFGVIPVVYEYEGTTLESLMSQLELSLLGRSARSLGFFTHSEVAWELKLVHGATVTIDTLNTPEFIQFFETVANQVLPVGEGGHIDMFSPLGSCEPGTEMLTQLNILTGMKYTSPTGIVGNYNHVNSEWSSNPEGSPPPQQYFCSSKLNVWANTADQVKEACEKTKEQVGCYFEQKQRDVVSQLVGQIVFDATGQVDIQGLSEITHGLVDSLVHLGDEQNKSEEDGQEIVKNPLQFLGRYLLEIANGKDRTLLTTKPPLGGTLAPASTMKAKTLSSHLELDENFEGSLQNSEYSELDSEVAQINKGKKEKKNKHLHNAEKEDDDEEEIEEDIDGFDEEVEEEETLENYHKPRKTKSPNNVQFLGQTGTMKSDMGLTLNSSWGESERDPGLVTARSITGTHTLAHSQLYDGKTPRRATLEHLKENPEKRMPVAKEILSTEIEYMRTMEIVKNVYLQPLRAALGSNRAIVSTHNIQMLFTDPINLLELSRELVEDLKKRLSDWGPHQCLGDIFVKFTGNMKVYVNYLNNYPIILMTVERAAEEAPRFRAFLKRHDRTPETKMLSLAELLLAPARRIGDYVTLLTWFHTHTPADHADRADLSLAIKTLNHLNQLFIEARHRLEGERQLMSLQKRILNCPILLEANRFFLKQLDVAHLKPPQTSVIPELRVYQHIETLGMFLFNDGLVVTRRVTKHQPFERCHAYVYRFEACVSLTRLRIEDIPDSKYAHNVLRLYTPKRSWVIAADSFDDKFNWLTLIEQTVRAALEDK